MVQARHAPQQLLRFGEALHGLGRYRSALLLVPLTAGDHRLGALGGSSEAPLESSPAEVAFLERVSEFAGAVDGAPTRKGRPYARRRHRSGPCLH